MKRKVYLSMHSRQEAREIFFARFGARLTQTEKILSRDAMGRVIAEPVFARFSSPAFHSAAMDGLAVRAEDTFGASDDNPLMLDIASSQAVLINTGHPLPDNKNAVVMIEDVILSEDEKTALLRTPVYPWQHVRKMGEDIVATELLFPAGHIIVPADTAALLTAGCLSVTVYKKPLLTIIPTGSELVELEGDEPLQEGKTIESNSAVLAGMAQNAGAEVRVAEIVKDEYEEIKKALLAAVSSAADMVVINAGSSAGSADYTFQIIEELGEVMVHGVTIMPGKPTILGVVGDKPVIGIPGYPVSAIMAFEQFGLPLLASMQGTEMEGRQQVKALLAKDIPSKGGIEEFRRMITARVGNGFVTVPLKKGAGAITTLTRANSLLRISSSSEGEKAGTQVGVELLKPASELEKTVLATGSHDLSLDVMHGFLKKSRPSFNLASTHVGSLGGLMAIRDNFAHIAGTHLLDVETGEYNLSYVQKYLPERQVVLLTLVHREQGLIVRKGNPKNIKGIADIEREDITYINRQAGSGTRVLFDFELEKHGLNPDNIAGYNYEEYTHMAVAVAVLSGKADAGLGIMAAARALNMDFIPITEERYDLLIPQEFMELPMIKKVTNIIVSADFKQMVENMGGYSTKGSGSMVLLGTAL